MHFSYLIMTGLTGLVILLLAEYGYHKSWWHGEGARKLAHIVTGCFVALWPWYLDWFEIRLISIALTLGFIVCMQLRLFQSIVSIKRLSYGEVLFTLMIGGVSLLTTSRGIYGAAILHMALADGIAALVGTRFGKKTRYKVFGHTKSLVGTGAFFVVSLVILATYTIFSGGDWTLLYILGGASGAMILENLGILGLDNLFVPIFVAVFLSHI